MTRSGSTLELTRTRRVEEPEGMDTFEECDHGDYLNSMELVEVSQTIESVQYKACETCQEKGNSEQIRSCDFCNRGWHKDCLKPAPEVSLHCQWRCSMCPAADGTSQLLPDTDHQLRSVASSSRLQGQVVPTNDSEVALDDTSTNVMTRAKCNPVKGKALSPVATALDGEYEPSSSLTPFRAPEQMQLSVQPPSGEGLMQHLHTAPFHNVDARCATFNEVHGSQYNYFHDPSKGNSAELSVTGHTELNILFDLLRRATVTDASYNARRRSPPPCHPGTRTDILTKINECLSEPQGPSVCWLYGLAGTGKSAIAQSVSEHFAGKRKLAASFFFNRDEDRRCSTQHVAATIAYQLAFSIPALKRHICDVLEQDETVLNAVFKDQFQKLIIEPLRLLPETDAALVIVIDALDECEDSVEIEKLMALLANPTAGPRFSLRFFITSRPEIYIRWKEVSTDNHMHLSYNLQKFTPDADIRSFLKHSLRDIRRGRGDVMHGVSLSWPSGDELDALVKKSSSLFIYASTVVKFIGEKRAIPHRQLAKVLAAEDNPSAWGDLDRLYTQVLSVSSHNLDLLRSVIGAIILLRTPLTPRELAYLLAVEVDDLLLVLQGLHSILSVPEDPDQGTVTTFHLSLHDFLTCRDRAGIYFINSALTHAHLAQCCLKLISTLPKCPLPIFRDPIWCRRAVEEHLIRILGSERTAIQYACWYWSSHLSEARAAKTDLVGNVKEFCRYYIIPWNIFLLDVELNLEMEREQDWARARKWKRACKWEQVRARARRRQQRRRREQKRALRRAGMWERALAWTQARPRVQVLRLLMPLFLALVMLMVLAIVLKPMQNGMLAAGAAAIAVLGTACLVIVLTLDMQVPLYVALHLGGLEYLLPQLDVARCVLQAQWWIDEMSVLDRIIFYRALQFAANLQERRDAEDLRAESEEQMQFTNLLPGNAADASCV